MALCNVLNKIEDDMNYFAVIMPVSCDAKERENVGRSPAINANMNAAKKLLQFGLAYTSSESQITVTYLEELDNILLG